MIYKLDECEVDASQTDCKHLINKTNNVDYYHFIYQY